MALRGFVGDVEVLCTLLAMHTHQVTQAMHQHLVFVVSNVVVSMLEYVGEAMHTKPFFSSGARCVASLVALL